MYRKIAEDIVKKAMLVVELAPDVEMKIVEVKGDEGYAEAFNITIKGTVRTGNDLKGTIKQFEEAFDEISIDN